MRSPDAGITWVNLAGAAGVSAALAVFAMLVMLLWDVAGYLCRGERFPVLQSLPLRPAPFLLEARGRVLLSTIGAILAWTVVTVRFRRSAVLMAVHCVLLVLVTVATVGYGIRLMAHW